ncbi:MAG: hypothetical protein JSS76_04115 [Bacteroidetes bacterium]|nr:hypothetical protein [Bacteroidota bacterium]
MIRKSLVPDGKTVTLSFKVPSKYIGKKIEVIAFDKSEENESEAMASPSLPGNPMSVKEFKNWIKESEEGSSISLAEAKNRWESQRRKLRQLTK